MNKVLQGLAEILHGDLFFASSTRELPLVVAIPKSMDKQALAHAPSVHPEPFLCIKLRMERVNRLCTR